MCACCWSERRSWWRRERSSGAQRCSAAWRGQSQTASTTHVIIRHSDWTAVTTIGCSYNITWCPLKLDSSHRLQAQQIGQQLTGKDCKVNTDIFTQTGSSHNHRLQLQHNMVSTETGQQPQTASRTQRLPEHTYRALKLDNSHKDCKNNTHTVHWNWTPVTVTDCKHNTHTVHANWTAVSQRLQAQHTYCALKLDTCQSQTASTTHIPCTQTGQQSQPQTTITTQYGVHSNWTIITFCKHIIVVFCILCFAKRLRSIRFQYITAL